MDQWLVVGADGLDPSGVVDVDDRRDAVDPALSNPVHEQHVRAGERSAVEDLLRLLSEHHRGDGSKAFAALDSVEAVEVGGMARMGEQAAMAQRPRPELAASLEPGDDLVTCQRLGDLAGDRGRTAVCDTCRAQGVLYLCVAPLGPECGSAHR